jgi:hypothetical protein
MLFAYVVYDLTTGRIHHDSRDDLSHSDHREWISAMNFLQEGTLKFAETIDELELTTNESVVE